jgi:regulator of sigma E protease
MINIFPLAAVDLATIAYWTWIVVKVAIGLGAVIFVHELGHFLVAKACGVKCDKFFIGFDIGGYKISRKWGETEYGIGILPLGGYVKMLGQDDDPGHIAEQMQKSQIDSHNANAKEITGPRGEKYFVDRRSYLAKSVPQRMAIISAGVIMNVIFAFVFAVVAYGLGVPYQPSIVSETAPGSPAWIKNLEAGDEITRIGNREEPTVLQLKGAVTLASQKDGIDVRVRRASTGQEEEIRLTPDRGRSRLGTIGVIFGPVDLTLQSSTPAVKNSAAANATLISPEVSEVLWGAPKLQGGDTIVRVGDTDVKNYRELTRELSRLLDQTISIVVRRREPTPKDAEEKSTPNTQDLTFEIAPTPLKRFGLKMKMGPVAAVQVGSPAADAGLHTDDVILSVDGQPVGDKSEGSIDSMLLPEHFRKAALAGRTVKLDIARGKREGATPEQLSLTLTPQVPTMNHATLMGRAPLAVPAAGFAYYVSNEVVEVVSGGPAANAKLQPGDRITSVTFISAQSEDGSAPESLSASLDDDNAKIKISWPAILSEVQFAPSGTSVEFAVKSPEGKETKITKLTPAEMAGAFYPDRGFRFEPIEKTRKAETLAEQLKYGKDETVDSLLTVYRFLHKLGDEVPFTALGGPVTIAAAAGQQASQGLSSLLIFLTMLSANLAVVNFLPIPVLDGGHMVFLLYEGIRGRPANERFVVAMHMIGFAFIATLMLFVLGLDVGLIPRGF